MSPYFPKPYEPIGGDINVKVDLSNYATKTDLKNVSYVDVSSFTLKSNLASLKTEVDKLDFDKLTLVPNDLAKLRNVVKNDVAKNTEYDKLVAKINNIDTAGFVLKTTYDTDESDLEKKISDTKKKIHDASDLAKKTPDFNAKITEIEGKIPSITGLATDKLKTVPVDLAKLSNVVKNDVVKKIEYNKLVTKVDNIDTTNFVKKKQI